MFVQYTTHGNNTDKEEVLFAEKYNSALCVRLGGVCLLRSTETCLATLITWGQPASAGVLDRPRDVTVLGVQIFAIKRARRRLALRYRLMYLCTIVTAEIDRMPALTVLSSVKFTPLMFYSKL